MPSRRPHLPLVLAALLVSLACVLYPLYVIRPFRAQGPAELEAALAILQLRPWIIGVCSLLALALTAAAWRQPAPRWRKISHGAALLAFLAVAIASRVNIFEIMFHRIESPAFDPASRSTLEGGEKVLAIQAGGAARAYPVRALAYHHIVNDTLGGIPLVGTY